MNKKNDLGDTWDVILIVAGALIISAYVLASLIGVAFLLRLFLTGSFLP